MTGPRAPLDAPGGHVPDRSPEPPYSVWLARWLWMGAAVVGLARSLLQLSDRRMLVEELRRVDPDLSQYEVDAATNSGIMVALLFMVGMALLYVFFGNRMARGSNWARVLVMVLCGLFVCGTLLSLLTLGLAARVLPEAAMPSVAVGPLGVLLSTVIAGLNVAVFVLLLRGESRRFFAEAGERRRG
ncbi:hypothetical protein [Actinopolyspora erythraea]|uniref:hypothetical protein n=1 Tax=Actinopolyspora erythraea TaxID=414996 RepID=UPI000A6186EB|nr:hypothetical protein [Actinopolyspora erythraea]